MPNLIIVGLGNPGSVYAQTRHNVGFMVVDSLAQNWGLSWQTKTQWQAEVAMNQDVILVKPQTFMNRSGDAVVSLMQFYKWTPDQVSQNLIIIHDDLDIMLGQYKKTLGRGPKQHNGLSSVEASLGTDQFIRYRIGVDSRQGERRVSGDEYVLSTFRPEERTLLSDSINQVVQELSHAQNR